MSFLLRLTSPLSGRKVGTDRFGTVYYESRAKQAIYNRTRRWAIFAKGKDPKEIERLRSNKARKRPSNASDTGSRTVKGGSGDAAVTRQQVNRQTVRPDENGKQVVDAILPPN